MIDPVTISIIHQYTQKVIDHIEYSRAFFTLHEQAIFMHRGQQFMVKQLILSEAKAIVIPVTVNYMTSARNSTIITVLHDFEQEEKDHIHYGMVKVVHKVFGFVKMYLKNGIIFEIGECSLPPLEYETTAVWIDLPVSLKYALEAKQLCPIASMHAVNHVLLTIGSLRGCCDRSDLQVEHDVATHTKEHPFRMLLYDQRPGGLGACANIFSCYLEVFQAVYEILQQCPCALGCPACILDSSCTAYNIKLSKIGGLELIRGLLDLQQKPNDPLSPHPQHQPPPLTSHQLMDDTNDNMIVPTLSGEKRMFDSLTESLHTDTPASTTTAAHSHSSLLSPSKQSKSKSAHLHTPFEDVTPKKKKRQLTLKKLTMKDNEQTRSMVIRDAWVASNPEFITDFGG
jgi:ATP-dependent helicase YprA (DUF1998 family)